MTHSIDYLGISININILYYMYWILSLKGEVRWEGMRVHGLALSLSLSYRLPSEARCPSLHAKHKR